MHLEQVAFSPDVVASPDPDARAASPAFLCPQLLLLLLDPAQLGNGIDRGLVSRFIRDGAEIRTLPVGGFTLRWTS